jgi:hypothetical protein
VPPPAALATMRHKVIIDGVGIIEADRGNLDGVRLLTMGRG